MAMQSWDFEPIQIAVIAGALAVCLLGYLVFRSRRHVRRRKPERDAGEKRRADAAADLESQKTKNHDRQSPPKSSTKSGTGSKPSSATAGAKSSASGAKSGTAAKPSGGAKAGGRAKRG
ncbi:hypothetical protein GCM10023174_18270 [Chelativorans composti]